MTEEEWLACADPAPMLAFLRGKASDRKLRLFSVGACRRIWHLLENPALRSGVESAERHADGRTKVVTLERLNRRLTNMSFPMPPRSERFKYTAAIAVLCTTSPTGHYPPEKAYAYVVDAVAEAAGQQEGTEARVRAAAAERAALSRLLRCVFGNPFRTVPAVAPECLSRSDGTVRKLATTIYTDRAFDRLPVLADALEDAGCADAALLAHCRQPGEHVRGCWAVDLILGKG